MPFAKMVSADTDHAGAAVCVCTKGYLRNSWYKRLHGITLQKYTLALILVAGYILYLLEVR